MTFDFCVSGTPRPNKKGTYDFSSSVMNSKAPPLRPEEKWKLMGREVREEKRRNGKRRAKWREVNRREGERREER